MRIFVLAAAVLIALGLMGGCEDQAKRTEPVDVDQLRADLADDLVTYGATQGQVDNQITRTSYHNLRGLNQDLLHLLLLERPSRHIAYPVE